MNRLEFRCRVFALSCMAILAGQTSTAAGQVPGTPYRSGLEYTKPPIVTKSESGYRVTVGPGLVGCRALLIHIAHQAGFAIENVEHVPDVEVFVEFSAAPLIAVVDKLLGYTKVDFVLVGRGNSELVSAAVSVRRATDVAQPVVTNLSVDLEAVTLPADSGALPVPAPVYLPPIESDSRTPDRPTIRSLDVRPAVIEIQAAPVWQPVAMTPTPVPVPSPRTLHTIPVPVPLSPPVPSKPSGGK